MKVIEFKGGDESFSAFRRAGQWCRENGYTVGSMENRHPIGIHRNVSYISKWTNMTAAEHESLNGMIVSSDFRNGNAFVIISDTGENA